MRLLLPPRLSQADPWRAQDLYDLGEFDVKGGKRTKWGTKEEYLSAIKEAKKNGIVVYIDAVLNHKVRLCLLNWSGENELTPCRRLERTSRSVSWLPRSLTRIATRRSRVSCALLLSPPSFAADERRLQYEIEGWTGFDFPGRGDTYSKMKWHHYHFTGAPLSLLHLRAGN